MAIDRPDGSWLDRNTPAAIAGIVFVGVLALCLTLSSSAARMAEAQAADDACAESCRPFAHRYIDDVCHCATDDGWTRSEVKP